ncbi:hypothetical protein [Streptomyces sp. t39]|uniref:hypothetical protein n=1 Tax=Streptomyces sp. t39 TaxID=1828156 RepID=UPI0011CD778A|nr:hypothetical protein [Streptomyces sp. t39]TXS50126.1 hypothetical protein EAO77_27845 [Streptomyces sp. t39]
MTVHVETVLNVPLDDGRLMPTRMGIAAELTPTPGLVVFPKLIDLFDYDDTIWHVTHVATGRMLPIDFPTDAHASAYAAAVGDLADWTSPTPTIDVPALIARADVHDGTVHQRVLDALTRKEN